MNKRSLHLFVSMIASLLLSFGVIFGTHSAHAVIADPVYQHGDLIFHQSQSSQSAALREATESPWTHMGMLVLQKGKWYVAEASAKVTVTPLNTFINRGKGRLYVIKRLKQSVATVDTAALNREIADMKNLPYDIYFEWTDDSIYCSELVYKTYSRAMNVQIGRMQKFRDMRLDGPEVQKLIEDRLTRTGRELNLDEPIITPISMMDSPLLETVVDKSGTTK